jgi:hypothetical protein
MVPLPTVDNKQAQPFCASVMLKKYNAPNAKAAQRGVQKPMKNV